MEPQTEGDIQAICRDISRRQRYRRGPQKMSEVLSALMTRRGYARVRSPHELQDAWNSTAGEKMSENSRVGVIRRGVLEVHVRNSATLQELTFQKRQLIRKLTELAPDHKIRDLRFRVGGF